MINICIIHYNTPELTDALVKSIEHFTPNSNIYIFDNSDKRPFVTAGEYPNVTVLDNTKGQIINFDEWLEKYPNRYRSRGALNNFGSAKHCYSVQKFMDMFNENFILLDSDVLLKRDITSLCNENFVYVGEIGVHKRLGTKRVYPFICYINNKYCKSKDIKYYNESFMHGLFFSAESERYDTGGGFYMMSRKENVKEIKYSDYVVHYEAGSWKKENSAGSGLTSKQWLEKNKNLWNFDKNGIVLSLTSYKERLRFIPQVLKPIWNGSVKPIKTVLSLDEKDVPFINSESPELKSFIDSGRVELIVSREDIKPHTKYFFAMKKYRNNIIVTIDDDIIYPQDTIESLYKGYLIHPDCIIARRVHKIRKDSEGKLMAYNKWDFECIKEKGPSKFLFATGVGGVLYPPNILEINDSLLSEIKKCLNADDVYLKYLQAKKGISVYYVGPNKKVGLKVISGSQKKALSFTNTQKVRNIENNDDYMKKFPPFIPKSKVIYTCITGGYDNILQPQKIDMDFDYICFTDDKEWLEKGFEGVWEFRAIPESLKHLSPVQQQRTIKICPHRYLSEYDISLWIDGSIQIKDNLAGWVEETLNKDKACSIFIPRHPSRNCIYEEAKACIGLKKDKEEIINKQIEEYKKEGFPHNIGMVQSGIILRKHNEAQCKKLMESWAEKLLANSIRDQLSFNYVLWKNSEVKVYLLDKMIFRSKWFQWNSNHKRKPSPKKEKKKTGSATLTKSQLQTALNGWF